MAKDRYTEERDRQEEAKKRNADKQAEKVDDTIVDPTDDGSNDSVVSEDIVVGDDMPLIGQPGDFLFAGYVGPTASGITDES